MGGGVTGESKRERGWQRRAFQGEKGLQDGMQVPVREHTWPSLGNCKLFRNLLPGAQMEACWKMRLGELVCVVGGRLQDCKQNSDTVRFNIDQWNC